MIKLLIKAPFARFTNHGEKNDLTTYDIPTPSSLVGLIGSIYGKPEFNWEIRSIEVLNEIKRVKMTTNGWYNVSYTAPTPDKRAKHTQNSRVYLADVAYVVEVEPSIPLYRDNIARESEGVKLVKKHEEILRRRIERMEVGSGRNVVFLGKNDCPCTVELVTDETVLPKSFYKDKESKKFYSIPIIQTFRRVDFSPIMEENGKKLTEAAAMKKVQRAINKAVATGCLFKSRYDGCYYKSNFHHKDLTMKHGKIEIKESWYNLWATNCNH